MVFTTSSIAGMAMYISGDENVYPTEVENVLYQIAGVAEAVDALPRNATGKVHKPTLRAQFLAAAIPEPVRIRDSIASRSVLCFLFCVIGAFARR